jgi:hypothetical protein
MRRIPRHSSLGAFAALAAALMMAPAHADQIRITVTDDQPGGGFALAPVWFGLHNGSFDTFHSGAAASSPLETLAELGNTASLSSLFGGSGPQTTLTSGGLLPQFLPGQSASTVLDVANPAVDRYLSFAAMVVPSNDFFMGNDNPLAHPLFDAGGHFLGPVTIQIFGADVWDAGTEVNNITFGAAFIQGDNATDHVAENSVVTPFLPRADASSYLSSILGQTTAAGYEMTHVFSAGDPIATIRIASVPEPASIVLLSIGLAGTLALARAGRPRSPGGPRAEE